MASELDDDIHARITQLSAEGDALVEEEDYAAAIERYREALSLIPEPRGDWEATHWLLTAIGEAQFFDDNYEAAAASLHEANEVHAQLEGEMNAFILLRLGQSLYELADETDDEQEEEKLRADAMDCLTRVYLSEGEEIFEDEDRKYLKQVKRKLRPPQEDEKRGVKKFWPFS